MPLARMSSLSRLLDCPGYQLVVQDDRPSSDNAHEARVWGTDVHAAKEGEPRLVYGPLPQEDVEAMEQLRERYLGWEHEVHVSYDLATHRAAQYATDGEKRDCCNDSTTTLTGCIDALLVDPFDETVYINDLKTGEDPVALDEPQLLGYALAALSLAIQDKQVGRSARVNLSVLHYPRKGWWRKKYLEEDGKPWRWNARDVPLDEMRAFRTSLVELLPKVASGILQAGDWCCFCPGHSACPLWTARRELSNL